MSVGAGTSIGAFIFRRGTHLSRKLWILTSTTSVVAAAAIAGGVALGTGGTADTHAAAAVDQVQHYSQAEAQAVAQQLADEELGRSAQSRAGQGLSDNESAMALVDGRPVAAADMTVLSGRYVGAATDGTIHDSALDTDAAASGVWVFTFVAHNVQVTTPGLELADGTLQVDVTFDDGSAHVRSAGVSVYPEGIAPKSA